MMLSDWPGDIKGRPYRSHTKIINSHLPSENGQWSTHFLVQPYIPINHLQALVGSCRSCKFMTAYTSHRILYQICMQTSFQNTNNTCEARVYSVMINSQENVWGGTWQNLEISRLKFCILQVLGNSLSFVFLPIHLPFTITTGVI